MGNHCLLFGNWVGITIYEPGEVLDSCGAWKWLISLKLREQLEQLGFYPFVFHLGRTAHCLDLGFFVLCGLAIWSIPEAGRQLGEPDHGQIVIDEWAGMWLAAFGVRFYTDLSVWIGLCFGFIGFRIFDITKPGVVSWCERKFLVHGVF